MPPPDLPAYTRDELENRARSLIKLRVPSADVAPGTDYDVWARILGTVAFGLQSQGSTLLRLIDPRRAFGAVLREHADSFAIGRELGTSVGAIAATGSVIIRSTTGSQLQTAGSALTHADGTAYTLDANVTTSATAAKVLRSGARSTRRRIYQGHLGGGFITAAVGEIYEYDATGEYVALHGVDDADISNQFFVDLTAKLSQDPSTHDTLTQQFGAVGLVTCAVGGVLGNKDVGDVLTITTPAGTIVATAQILTMGSGSEAMSVAQMQNGLRALLGSRLSAMPMADIYDLALGADGISKIVDCSIFPASGEYTLYPYEEGSPFMTATRAAEVGAFVDARIAVPDRVTTATLVYRVDVVDVIEVRVQASVAPDFDIGSAGAMVVGAASTTTRIELAAPVPANVQVGDRIILSARTTGATKTAPYIVQRVVDALGASYIDVDEALPYPPDAAVSFVTAGGPAGQRVIDAVLAHYDEQRAESLTFAYVYPAPDTTSHKQGLTARVAEVSDVLDVALYPNTSAPPSVSGEVATPTAITIKMWGG